MFFLESNPPLTAMIQCSLASDCIDKIRRSLDAGAEAFGIQLCRLKRSERSEEKIRAIFEACDKKPIYVTSYRTGESTGMTDDECAELLLLAARSGADLLDIPADFFDGNPYQITNNPIAVAKEMQLVEKIHALGGHVLFSTHDFRDLTGEEVFQIASLQKKRGADVLKVVVKSASFDRLPEYIAMIQKVKKELALPFLFLDIGACSNMLRKLGGAFGSCMYLCVESHGEFDTPQQPLISVVKQIRDNLSEK